MNQFIPRFIETIRLQGGVLHHLPLHQARVDGTLAQHALPTLDLKEVLAGVESQYSDGLYKCRVLYGGNDPEVEVRPYSPLVRRCVSIVSTDMDYSYKYADRTRLDVLLRSACSDDVILVKDGLVTDSAIANLVFESSSGLFTPRVPLLAGVQREHLLQQHQIRLADIRVEELGRYEYVHFINAMVPLRTIAPFPIRRLEVK